MMRIPLLASLRVAAFSVLCLIAISACAPGAGTLQNATMTAAVDANMRPVDRAAVFPPMIPEIFCSVKINDALEGTEIRADWIYITGEAAERDHRIDSNLIVTEGTRYLGFSLERGEHAWPIGDYKVMLFVNGEEQLSVPFRVENNAMLSDAVMAASVDPVLFTPVEIRSIFDVNSPKIYCYVKLTDAPSDTEVQADWVHIVDESKREGTPFGSNKVVTEGGLRHIAFSLTRPDTGWQKGKYMVVLHLNGQAKIALPFEID